MDERQMVMELSGPNKTFWIVIQNIAFERLLKRVFSGKIYIRGIFKAINLKMTCAPICSALNEYISWVRFFDN